MPNQSRKYDHFFPNVALTFPVGNVKMNMVYKVTVSRPSYSQLVVTYNIIVAIIIRVETHCSSQPSNTA